MCLKETEEKKPILQETLPAVRKGLNIYIPSINNG